MQVYRIETGNGSIDAQREGRRKRGNVCSKQVRKDNHLFLLHLLVIEAQCLLNTSKLFLVDAALAIVVKVHEQFEVGQPAFVLPRSATYSFLSSEGWQ